MKAEMWCKLALCAAALAALGGCASEKTPATADVAVSKNAVANAQTAGAADVAPAEMASARDKMQRASAALAAKDYDTARDLAQQAQADAQLALAKANSAKSTAAANQLQSDLNVLRQELDRASAPKPAQ
jgi:membrane-associated HD superfamily phosphohydrolase